ncbi:Cytochrome c oxidase subunit 5b-1 [Durusdinium trenchii]|uniref:Mitochondrial n=1 Tax=Durusdinium trenchii TaxID=1381693 RepID=A0ABP0Q374_9DINO
MSRLFLPLALALSLCAGPSHAQLMRRATPSHRGRLQRALREALAKVTAQRVLFVEETLRASYEAFPKDAKGNLPPHQALPALARAYFAKEHGWLVRGLEPPGAPIIAPGETYQAAKAPKERGAGDLYAVHALEDKAPELAAALKEAALSPVTRAAGLSLADVAQAVAALEQILLEESVTLVREAYVLNGLETDMQRLPGSIPEDQALEVLLSYLLLFRNGVPIDMTNATKHRLIKERARKTVLWLPMKRFVDEALEGSEGERSWAEVKEATMQMAKQFGRWQNSECEEMRSTLRKMEHAPGRVRLEDFHGSPKFTNYQFTEKEDYLQQAGILEEKAGERSVLIANYLLGASNCIASSEYFSVCCLNECEVLVNQFEAAVQAPGAPVSQVMQVARELNASAVDELADAADESQVVVWHTAGFRHWLHRAFPYQCPRPTASEDQALQAELAEAQEWMKMDEAARQKWKPLVVHPSECTRLPQWHEEEEEATHGVVELEV